MTNIRYGNILSVRRIGAELFSVAVSSHLKLFRAAWYVWDPQIFISEGKIVKKEGKGWPMAQDTCFLLVWTGKLSTMVILNWWRTARKIQQMKICKDNLWGQKGAQTINCQTRAPWIMVVLVVADTCALFLPPLNWSWSCFKCKKQSSGRLGWYL